jgi:glutaredoxin
MTLYTKDNCPRCNVLKTKLYAKGISFVEIKDEDVIESLGIEFLPVLKVHDDLLDFGKANEFINSL